MCVGTTEELKQMLEHDRTERENREVGKHRNDGSVQSVCKEQTDNQIQESCLLYTSPSPRDCS